MSFDACGRRSRPSAGTRVPAATAGSPGPARTRPCASGSPARPPRAAWTSPGPRRQPVGLVGRPGRRGGGRPTRAGHRQPPGLGARRRRVRRPARRRVRLRRGRPAAGAGVQPRPGRSAVASFGDEEGARFGIACAGSRLLTGALDPDRARALRDADGVTMAEAMAAAGHDPAHLGPDHETLRRIGMFVELHVEQGRGLVDLGPPVGVGSAIWPHGRWRFDLAGRGQPRRHHPAGGPPRPDAGAGRGRPGRPLRRAGARRLATVGKVLVEPNGVNAIPSPVTAWLDARGPVDLDVRAVVAGVGAQAGVRAGRGVVDPRDRVRRRAAPVTSPGCSTGRRCCRPAPATTPASWPRRGSRPRCCSSATRPGSPTPPGARRAGRLPPRGRGAGPGRPRAGRMSAGSPRRWFAEHALLPSGPRAPCCSRWPTGGSPRSPRTAPPATPNGWPGWCCPASPTRTRTPSTAPCAAARTTAAARSGPGASGCTPSPRGSTRTPTSRWPGRRTRRWRWPG